MFLRRASHNTRGGAGAYICKVGFTLEGFLSWPYLAWHDLILFSTFFPRQFPFLVYIMMSQVMWCHVTYLIHDLISDVILFWLIVRFCLFDRGFPHVYKQGQAAATQQGLTSLSIHPLISLLPLAQALVAKCPLLSIIYIHYPGPCCPLPQSLAVSLVIVPRDFKP